MPRPTLGIIGGSGLYDLPGLTSVHRTTLDTPFGAPSDAYVRGLLGEQELVFLPRHGVGHRFTPSEVNYRANIHGMKQLGVERILSISAVGSMKEAIAPGNLVIPDQFIDRTFAREKTFFGAGVVAHVSFSDPLCPQLRHGLEQAARTVDAVVHTGGTYLCMEGPQFSTRAESLLYRTWGVEVIGMTNLPEAKLAREAEICYATLALATDYDCWNADHAAVSVEQVIAVLLRNVAVAKEVIRALAQLLPGLGPRGQRGCGCAHALDHAVLTDPKVIPPAARERLSLLLGDRFRS